MISIQPTTYDLEGGLVFTPLADTENRNGARRTSRRRLLDGTVSIYDGGYSDGDRTLTLRFNPTAAQLQRLEAMAQLYNRVTVSQDDGCYRAVLVDWSWRAPSLSINVWIETKLSE